VSRVGETWEVNHHPNSFFLVVGVKENHALTGDPVYCLLNLETGLLIHRFTFVLDEAEESARAPGLEQWRRVS
jgi:hypothetical protein